MVATLNFGLLQPLDLSGAVQAFDAGKSRRIQQQNADTQQAQVAAQIAKQQADADKEKLGNEAVAKFFESRMKQRRLPTLGGGIGNDTPGLPPTMPGGGTPGYVPAGIGGNPEAPTAPMQVAPVSAPTMTPAAPVAPAGDAVAEPMQTVSAPREDAPDPMQFLATISRAGQGQLAMQLWEKSRTMEKDERKDRIDALDAFDQTLAAISTLPPEQQAPAIAQATPRLVALGMSVEDIQKFQPTPENFARVRAQALGFKGVLQQQDVEGDNARAEAEFAYRQQNDATNRAVTIRGQDMTRGNALISASASQGKLDKVPPAAVTGILGNASALRKVDAAIAALGKRPSSVGVGTGMLGSTFTNLNDPGGTTTRAAIAELSATKIHDLSGAAVSAAEFPRLAPFVPLVSDPPGVVSQKLIKFREILSEELAQQKTFYGPQNGYRPVQGVDAPAATPKPAGRNGPVAPGQTVRIKTDAEYGNLKSGTPFIGPDGKRRVKP